MNPENPVSILKNIHREKKHLFPLYLNICLMTFAYGGWTCKFPVTTVKILNIVQNKISLKVSLLFMRKTSFIPF